MVDPKTRSPGLNRRTPRPTDSTSPANTKPSTGFLGRVKPMTIRIGSHNAGETLPLLTMTSLPVTTVARM